MSENEGFGIMKYSQSAKSSVSIAKLLNGIWLFSVLVWGAVIINRVCVAIADGYLSTVEFSQIFATSLIFISWLYFKPLEDADNTGIDSNFQRLYECQSDLTPQRDQFLHTVQLRMSELQSYHVISQEYVFPFPYLCQIYHLLNLKHLEKVHGFSLNNLRIIKVSDFQLTETGGAVRFQTVLESPINTLRIWRKPLVEVDLILHTPYMVELNIPAYNDKRIVVMFNVVPLKVNEHKLFIDIYSNLEWPRPILQMLFHLASCLTVFEDFPYLRKLAERNLERLIQSSKIPNTETMWLFRRFTELYEQGQGFNRSPSLTAVN